MALFLCAPVFADEKFKDTLKKAEQGDVIAQFNLGFMYDFGRGVPLDKTEAVKWYRKAAEQGLADAQFNLSNMYRNGEGVPQDYTEAVKWYRMAAEQGNADAQYNLGVMYANADGVPKDKTARAKSGITVNVARTVEVALSSFLLSATTGSNLAGAPLKWSQETEPVVY